MRKDPLPYHLSPVTDGLHPFKMLTELLSVSSSHSRTILTGADVDKNDQGEELPAPLIVFLNPYFTAIVEDDYRARQRRRKFFNYSPHRGPSQLTLISLLLLDLCPSKSNEQRGKYCDLPSVRVHGIEEFEMLAAKWMRFEEYVAQAFVQKPKLLKYFTKVRSAKMEGKI